jgi:hypothetical protein
MGIEVEHSFSASVVRHRQSVAKVVIQSRVSVFEIVGRWPILDASDRSMSQQSTTLDLTLSLRMALPLVSASLKLRKKLRIELEWGLFV